MSVPLLSTDYFSKPEPTGSVSGTVARLLATAGQDMSARLEKSAAVTEARMMAPQLTQQFGNAYSKIASGDLSGFQDLAGAQAYTADNPLLSKMAQDASELGVHLANNVTQQQILKDRLATQASIAGLRTGATYDAREDGLDNSDYKQSVADVQKENDLRSKRNQASQNAASLDPSGQTQYNPEPMLPMPNRPAPRMSRTVSPSVGSLPPTTDGEPQLPPPPPGANPNGVTQPLQVSDTPAPGGASDSVVSPPVPSPQVQPATANSNPTQGNQLRAADILSKYNLGPKFTVEDGVPRFQDMRGNPVTISPEEESFMTGLLDQSSKNGGGSGVVADNSGPTNVSMAAGRAAAGGPSAAPGATQGVNNQGKKVDQIQFGNLTVQVGQPSDDQKFIETTRDIDIPGVKRHFEIPDIHSKAGALDAREQFIHSVGEMNSDPQAANFVTQFMKDTGGQGVVFRNEQKDTAGKVLSAKMYGMDKDGHLIAYNPVDLPPSTGKAIAGSPNDPAGKTASEVDGTFVDAYRKMSTYKDEVSNKFGVTVVPNPQQPKVASPADTLSPAMQQLHAQLNSQIYTGQGSPPAGKISKQQAQQQLSAAIQKESAGNLVNETYPKELKHADDIDAANAKSQAASKLPGMRDELKQLQSQLSNKGPNGLPLIAGPSNSSHAGLGLGPSFMFGHQSSEVSTTDYRTMLNRAAQLKSLIEAQEAKAQ